MAGRRAYAVDELAAADVVALSSNWEGSPIVAAEALQLGRPLVSTDVGDVAEVVESGVSGWLVAVGDEAAFGSALLASVVDPDNAERMGSEGLVRAGVKYDPEKLVDEVCAVYSKVVGR